MAESKKNVLYYKREDLTGMGPSKIQVFELENPGSKTTINVNGKLIELETAKVIGSINPMNPYVFIERYENLDLTTIDILYGSLDINRLKKDENARKTLFEEILTRKNLEGLTRKYCGAIPIVSIGTNGRKVIRYDREDMKAFVNSILRNALVGNRRTSIKMNVNDRNRKVSFSDLEGSSGSFWDRFFGKKKESSTKTELDSYLGTTTYTKNEGVICFKSGAVIFNKSLFSKLNYATKDEETGAKTQFDSILIGGLDFERMRTDQQYWQNFVDKFMSPSALKNARSAEMFPYIGNFTESGEIDFDPLIWDEFNKLSIGYR